MSGKNVGEIITLQLQLCSAIKSQMSFNLISSDDTLYYYSIDRLDY